LAAASIRGKKRLLVACLPSDLRPSHVFLDAKVFSSGVLSWFTRGLVGAHTPPTAPAMDGATSFADDEVLPPRAFDEQPEPDQREKGPLRLTLRSEYTRFAPGGTGEAYATVTVSAEDEPSEAAPRKAVDLVCVLDRSGSMTGCKLEDMKAALKGVFQELGGWDRVSVVTFSDGASRDTPLVVMSEEGKKRVEMALLGVFAGGGTDIGAGLELALRVLRQRRCRNSVTALLLLTDGQDSGARAALPSLLRAASSEGCSIYGFGLGEDHDSGLLRNLGEMARSPYTFLRTPSDMKPAFRGLLEGIFRIVAQRVQVRVQLSSCSLQEVHTPFEVDRPEEGELLVEIPDVMAGEEKTVLLRLKLEPDLSGEVQLLCCGLIYTDARKEVRVRGSDETLEVSCCDAAQPDEEPDADVSAKIIMKDVAEVLRAASAAGSSELARADLKAQEQKLLRLPGLVERHAPDLQRVRTAMQDCVQPHARAALGEQLLMLQLQRHCTAPSRMP